MINANSTLAEVQRNNATLYSVVNDENYGPGDMLARAHRHTTLVLKPIRQSMMLDPLRQLQFLTEKMGEIKYHLCMAMSWTMGMFNQLHVDLDEEMWKRFPGLCPYCRSVPCDCQNRRAKERHDLSGVSRGEKPVRVREWQAMFRQIYRNSLLIAALHLAEEMGEVNIVLHSYLGTHQKELFSEVVEELVDVVTNIFGVANCLDISMDEGMVEYFSDSCPGCKRSPCRCGYRTDVLSANAHSGDQHGKDMP